VVGRPITYDPWLSHYYGELLKALDARCQGRSEPDYGWFRDLDDDLWAILLSKHYSLYPNLRRALPDLPPEILQTRFTGFSGVELATQSQGFYRRLRDLYARHGAKPLSESRVLDFGCGWGRLTRYLARDVAPGNLFGCDPNLWILDLCKQTRVPARIAGIEEVPSVLPFQEKFDLIFAFSVFTHLSEETHQSCLGAIHAGLGPTGVLVLTVRPAAFITDGFASFGLESDDEVLSSLQRDEPTYAFAPETGGPLKPGTYGAAVINPPYMREHWSPLFSLVDVTLQMDDIYQVVVTLQKRRL
jgi:SAM-dependent methyltransferase